MIITKLIALITYYLIKDDIRHYSNDLVNYIIITYKHVPIEIIMYAYKKALFEYKKRIKKQKLKEIKYYEPIVNIKSQLVIVEDYSSSPPSLSLL